MYKEIVSTAEVSGLDLLTETSLKQLVESSLEYDKLTVREMASKANLSEADFRKLAAAGLIGVSALTSPLMTKDVDAKQAVVEPIFTDAQRQQDSIDLLTKFNYAESGNQSRETWIANTFCALNRLKHNGKYGHNLTDVIHKMSSAIRHNDPQWRLVSHPDRMTSYEKHVYSNIKQTMIDILNGQIRNPIKDATHFENVEAYGHPSWTKGATKVATIGGHTYYSNVK